MNTRWNDNNFLLDTISPVQEFQRIIGKMATNVTFGILAAIAAPFFMALGFIIWDVTWKESGASAFSLNMFKCNLAAIWFLVTSFIFGWSISDGGDGNIENEEVVFTIESVSFLILSGFIGIIIGDLAWLEALRLLGATQVLVIDCIKPFTAAFMSWLILNETINNIAYSGVVLTVCGILIVSLERERNIDHDCKSGVGDHIALHDEEVPNNDDENDDDNDDENDVNRKDYGSSIIKTSSPRIDENGENKFWKSRGYIFAVGNVILDTYGSILTKQFGKGMNTWAINLIRFGSAGIIMILISTSMFVFTRLKNIYNTSSNQSYPEISGKSKLRWYMLPNGSMNSIDWMKIVLGVMFVTYICPLLSNYALFQISLVMALTLTSISPLFALILEWPLKNTRPTLRACCGASLAVGGVILLSIFL